MIQTLTTFFKGMAMGAADIVPGVSGGTIAFITGIYDRLLGAINSVNFSVLKTLKNEGLGATWKQIDGTFLLTLFVGIMSSILILTNPILFLLETHPVLIWSFFFGLVFASIWLVGKQVKAYNLVNFLFFIGGTILAYWITTLSNLNDTNNLVYIFFAGTVAICAMILPGISGAFILMILGVYKTVITALKEKELITIAVFGLGCIIGLLSFSRLLKWLLNNRRAQTLSMLTGFLLGSLNKIWPWKNKFGDSPLYVHSDGREDWDLRPVLPENFEGENYLIYAILLFVGGIALILVMSRFEKKP